MGENPHDLQTETSQFSQDKKFKNNWNIDQEQFILK